MAGSVSVSTSQLEARADEGPAVSYRLFRRLRIAPGLTVNLSKSGPSLSIGGRGAHVTMGGARGRRTTVGLPGTGLYWTSVHRQANSRRSAVDQAHNPNAPHAARREARDVRRPTKTDKLG